MAGEKVLGALLTEASVMLKGLETNAADLAHLSARRTALQTLQVELTDLNQRQEAAKATLQQLSAQINAQQKTARTELRLLRKGVEAVYGDDAQKLEEFGIRVKS
jgi:hypothetical protein